MRRPWRIFAAGMQAQLQQVRAEPVDLILTSVLTPIGYSLAILLLMQTAGQLHRLGVYGILGPAVLSLWWNAVAASGELIEAERGAGTLELLVTTPPGAFEWALLGRITANTLLALLALGETTAVAGLGFGLRLEVADLLLFALGLGVLVGATIASALIMATTFILARSVRIFQNALTFPVYLLSGLAFPLSALPAWLHPVSFGIALSWGSDLLRSGAGQAGGYPPLLSLVCGLGLALGYGLLGHALFAWTERRVRRDGTLGSY